MKMFFKYLTLILVGLFVIVGISGCSSNQKSNNPLAKSNQSSTSTEAKTTVAENKPVSGDTSISESKLKAALNSYLKSDSTMGDVSLYRLTIWESAAIVNLQLSNATDWSIASETERKKYLGSLSKKINSLALDNLYSSNGKDEVTVSIELYSPKGELIGTADSYGEIRVNN